MWQRGGLKRLIEIVSDLKKHEVVNAALRGFESPPNCFHLSPDIDDGFGISRSRDLGIFEVGKHEVEFRVRQKIHALLEMPRVSPPMLLG